MKKSLLFSIITSVTIPVFAGIVLCNEHFKSKINFQTRNIKALSVDSNENSTLVSSSKEMVNISIKFDYDDFNYSRKKLPNESVENYRQSRIEAGKAYHTEKNKELLEKIDTSEFENLYVSKYMPYISFDCKNTELNDIYENYLKPFEDKSYIQKINISRANQFNKPNLVAVKGNWGITTTLNNSYGLTGNGVKVGILETGIADKTNQGIRGRVTTFNDYWFEEITGHATSVANIIGGLQGIAPGCTMYSAQVTGFDVIAEFDWFLDNGVHVVNMSYGETNPTGIYNDISAYIDSIVNIYGISCVAAVGNEGEESGHVGNPALGYNVLGVGQSTNTGSSYMLTSSYIEVEGPDKPNIMAPGIFSLRYGDPGSGTSYSSAYTTGVIALLMETWDEFKIYPERLYSILCATNSSLNGNNGSYFGPRDRTGVGVVAPVDALINIVNEEYTYFTTTTNCGELINLYLETRDRLKVCAFWRAFANGDASETAHTDYDIILYDEFYNKVTSSRMGRNNYEYFECVIPTTGYYQIDFHFALDRAQEVENYSLAWFVEPYGEY